MTLAIILVLAAVFALILILGVALLPGTKLSRNGHRAGQIQPLDVKAFRNLADRSEAEYLRLRLTASEFRQVQRARLRALAAYVHVASRNADMLIHAGQTALTSSDPHTAAAARELVDSALLLRRNATVALLRIYVALAWPSAGLAVTPILEGYQRLSGSAMLLGRLQDPGSPVRISAQ